MSRFILKIVLNILITVGLLFIPTQAESDITTIWEQTKTLIADIPFMEPVIHFWNVIETSFIVLTTPVSMEQERHNIVLKKLEDVNENIYRVEKSLDDRLDANIALDGFKKEIDAHAKSVEIVYISRYNQYLDLIKSGLAKDNFHRKEFSKIILNGDFPMENLLRGIYFTFRNLLLHVQQNKDYYKEFMCLQKKSIQQLIYSYYQKIIECEVKGYAMILYTSSVRDAINPEINKGMQIYALKQALDRTSNLVDYINGFINGLPRQLWNCNLKPQHSIEGSDYVKIGPIFQKYLTHPSKYVPSEVGERANAEARRGVISSYHHPEKEAIVVGNVIEIKGLEYGCEGVISNCTYPLNIGAAYCPVGIPCYHLLNKGKQVHTTGGKFSLHTCFPMLSTWDDLWPVFSETPGKRERYQYVEIERKLKVGEMCKKTETTPWGTLAHRWDWSNDWAVQICTCMDNSKDILRYVHAEWVTANRDYVITGVKIVPVNNTLYLQIKQGKLLPSFTVTSTAWKPINYVDPNSTVINSRVKVINLSYENNRIFLDDLEARHKNEVLTGIRFAPTSSGFQIDAKWSFFNFNNKTLMNHDHVDCYSKHQTIDCNLNKKLCGRYNKPLQYDPCFSKSYPELEKGSDRKNISLSGLDIPNHPRRNYRNEDLSKVNKESLFLTLTRDDFDYGQTLLPFIDIRPVDTYPPTPLSGIGLFRRASEKSAGYLAIKLITFDYKNIVNNVASALHKKIDLYKNVSRRN